MRIVGGELGGRRLVAPRGSNTRPTADRVREALFSALFDVEALTVLDLYAGSGAVGLEALSRGARSATFVENDRAALAALESNIAALGLEARCTVLRYDVARALRTVEGPFDLVFADPPYHLAKVALPAVLAADVFAPGARIVLEHRAADPSPAAPEGLHHRRTKAYGEAALAFFDKPE